MMIKLKRLRKNRIIRIVLLTKFLTIANAKKLKKNIILKYPKGKKRKKLLKRKRRKRKKKIKKRGKK